MRPRKRQRVDRAGSCAAVVAAHLASHGRGHDFGGVLAQAARVLHRCLVIASSVDESIDEFLGRTERGEMQHGLPLLVHILEVLEGARL